MVTLRFVYKEKVIHLSGKLSRQENTLHAQTNASLVRAIMWGTTASLNTKESP